MNYFYQQRKGGYTIIIVLLEKGECQQTSTPLKVGAAPRRAQKNNRMKKEKIKNYKFWNDKEKINNTLNTK